MIRAIASDLDGTFLGADGRPSERNVAAVLQAAERGVRTIFATGRPFRWLEVLRPLLEADPLVLASNGAVRYDLHHSRVISADLLDVESTLAVMSDLRATDPRLVLGVELLEGYAIDERFPLKEERTHLLLDEAVEAAVEARSPVKLLVMGLGVPSDVLAAEVTPVIDDRMTTTWSFNSEHGLLEVSRAGVTKGSGLAGLLDELGMTPDEVAAFGDMPNDLPMLELVGHPFRMDNAHPLLEQAGFPSAGDHDDSGVGRQIEDLLRGAGITPVAP
ncbi:HAD family hydrolase [Propionibacteriaceae bacterium Y1923]